MNDERHLKTWNIYQSAWAPIEDAERRALLTQSVSDDIVYTDPASQVFGSDALADRIAKSQEQFAGSRFRNDSFRLARALVLLGKAMTPVQRDPIETSFALWTQHRRAGGRSH